LKCKQNGIKTEVLMGEIILAYLEDFLVEILAEEYLLHFEGEHQG